MKTKKWNDYLWIVSIVYLVLGLFNIMFAWLGLLCFVIPLIVAIARGNKAYCNSYCGRGQLFDLLGKKLKISRRKQMPAFLRSKWFRYLFLAFFMTMFGLMIYTTYNVFKGKELQESIKILWTFRVPWTWAVPESVSPWIVQFALGFYGIMLTSTIIGLVFMVIFKPRAWCVICPMGTMTQGICELKNRKEYYGGGKSKADSGIVKSIGK